MQGRFQGLLVGRFPRRGQLATKLACTYHRTEIRTTLCMTLEHNLFCHVRPLSCNAGPKPNTPTTFSTKLRQAPTDLHSGSWSSLVCWYNYFPAANACFNHEGFGGRQFHRGKTAAAVELGWALLSRPTISSSQESRPVNAAFDLPAASLIHKESVSTHLLSRGAL